MRVVVFTKEPVPGRVKTRLVPELGQVGAAELHIAMTRDTLDNARLAGLEVEVALDGAAGWFDAPWSRQCEGDLGARMSAALAPGPALALGTDAPTLPLDLLRGAADALAHHDVVLGPAFDGGYWTVGVRTAQPALFQDIPWSTDSVFADTVARCEELGLSLCTLPFWYDVDTPASLQFLRQHLRTLPPDTAFRTRRCLSLRPDSPTT